MTVLSVLLDLTLSAHFMSDGSGSHCRMMSESPKEFSIFAAHIVTNMSVGPFVSTDCENAVSEYSHIHAEHFESVPATSFSMRLSHCITGSSLSSMMRSVRLCGSACASPSTHDVHHG